MLRRQRLIPVIGACFVVLVIIFGLRRHEAVQKDQFLFAIGSREYVLDVVFQDYATAGKVIRTSERGVETAHYVCGPRDAAVALVSIRDKETSKPIWASFVDAVDAKGHLYFASYERFGSATLFVLKSGFGTLPLWIDVIVSVGQIGAETRQVKFRMTKIATPRRVVAAPSVAEVNATAGRARASFNDVREKLSVYYVASLPANESVHSRILATSFGAGSPLGNGAYGLSSSFWEDYGRDIDAVKVRLDRMRQVDSEVRLTFRNAKTVSVGGNRFLRFPDLKQVAFGADFTALIVDGLSHERLTYRRRDSGGDAEIVIRIKRKKPNTMTSRAGDRELMPGLKLISVEPPLEELGLKSLRMTLLDCKSQDSGEAGVVETVKARGLPAAHPPAEVPVIRIRVRIRQFVLTGSSTVVLPVVHEKIAANPPTIDGGNGL